MYGKSAWLGKTHKEDTKEKIAAANRGKIYSEETKKRLSISMKEHWKKQRESRLANQSVH